MKRKRWVKAGRPPVHVCLGHVFHRGNPRFEKKNRVYDVFTISFLRLARRFTRSCTGNCSTCQHVKRAEIDRRLAAGEPGNRIARDYGLNPSSLHRHRTKCLQLAASNAIMREVARGTAAITLLPTTGDLSGGYSELIKHIDQIVQQAKQQGSLATAISGLNSIRHALDSLSRLGRRDRAANPDGNVANQNGVALSLSDLSDRLIAAFDREPEIKSRIARALLEIDDERAA